MKRLSLSTILVSLTFFSLQALATSSTLVDAVVASVNGKPITLQEVLARLPSKRKLTLQEASHDTEAKAVLESLIMGRLIEEDASARHITVSENELNSYIEEVARRNQLSRAAFEEALAREGLTLERYRERIREDILRSRLIAQYVQGGVTVSQEEIDAFVAEHSNGLSKHGVRLKLSQILILSGHRSSDELQARVQEISAKIEDGEEFSDVAKEYSEGPQAADGGSIGTVSLEDLSPVVSQAVETLDEGEVSKPVNVGNAVAIFKLEEKFVEEPEAPPASLQEEARAQLRQRKAESKMGSYFSTELPKLYPVERKM